MEGLIVVLIIVVVLAVILVGIYNGLIQRRLRIDEAFAQIDVQLKRRHDLIPNLVNAVKDYMGSNQTSLPRARQRARTAWPEAAREPHRRRRRRTLFTG